MRSCLAVQGAYFEKDVRNLNLMMIPNKNFHFFEFLELLKNFLRGLTNYFFKKYCTGASFQPITLAVRSFDS